IILTRRLIILTRCRRDPSGNPSNYLHACDVYVYARESHAQSLTKPSPRASGGWAVRFPKGGCMARRRIVGAAATALSLPLLLLVPASANASTSAAAAAAVAPTTQSDIRELSRTKFAFNGKVVELPKRYEPRVGARAATAAVETPPVGTVRLLPALDDFQGIIYIKEYTLRGVGENIEVWVANDLAFPAGDCRGADSTVVTDQQVADLITEF